MSNDKNHHVIFAVGGTGGHLYPAQALARQWIVEEPEIAITFVGGRLASNPFFDRSQFSYREIHAESPYRVHPTKAVLHLGRGVVQSLKLLRKRRPNLIIGFGSFYSVPILTAAQLLKIPYILVETNAQSGRVSRMFSARAKATAVQFPSVSKQFRGFSVPTTIPNWSFTNRERTVEKGEARVYFNLDPTLFTILVFGGSDGAQSINKNVAAMKCDLPYQVLHLCGKEEHVQDLQDSYRNKKIRATVKAYEHNMERAYRAADLAICRAGAGTISELIHFTLPAIFIPWPGASEDHQMLNAKAIEQKGGVVVLAQDQIAEVGDVVSRIIEDYTPMREAMEYQRKSLPEKTLLDLAREHLAF